MKSLLSPSIILKCLIRILEVLVLNKSRLMNLTTVLVFHIMNDSVGRRKCGGRMDGSCFSGSVLL